MYVCCVFVQYAAVCHYHQFVCVSGAPVQVRSGHRMFCNVHITKHTMNPTLVTAQSTAHEPPKDGRKYGPKHVGATSLKCS
jgi:hypothetical protein